ncbi:uncharacterized protein N7473_009700 [Penicillium subrubescens]|uniref:uncharacterized protein n=1 Tax=Penicillium subrubescens TaxID=1316194 RepID=UPI002544DCC7|nr:uncharacterized protein N7473_009700 [Penicillium subrubescens]KAJ5887026.1 hypothetical protein N7473_009700 [Penicillium subrubescens]
MPATKSHSRGLISGLISSFYIPRWRIFIQYLKSTPPASYNARGTTRSAHCYDQHIILVFLRSF